MNCAIRVLSDSKQFASPKKRVELALEASVVLSERVISEDSRAIANRGERLNWGG